MSDKERRKRWREKIWIRHSNMQCSKYLSCSNRDTVLRNKGDDGLNLIVEVTLSLLAPISIQMTQCLCLWVGPTLSLCNTQAIKVIATVLQILMSELATACTKDLECAVFKFVPGHLSHVSSPSIYPFISSSSSFSPLWTAQYCRNNISGMQKLELDR